MDTTFIITGGAGRVITAIPALEKYERLNPNDNFKILVNGWEQLFWSHPTLQKRTFGANQKGLFEWCIKNNRTVSPEPYQLYNFYNQKCNLVEAFDECINHTNDHTDLNLNVLYLSEEESQTASSLVNKIKKEHKKNKLVVFQPFGSTVQLLNNTPIDHTNRSLSLKNYIEIAKRMHNDAAVVYVSDSKFKHPSDKFSVALDERYSYIRIMMGVISKCDFFVGICSVGQHIARAFDKPGIIMMGSTFEQNFSYPSHFNIFRKKDRTPVYMPWRLSEIDSEFSDRENDGIMDFNDAEISSIVDIFNKNIVDNSLTNNNNYNHSSLIYE